MTWRQGGGCRALVCALALLGAGGLGGGCSGALLSEFHYAAGQLPEQRESNAPWTDKGSVLADLGVPDEILSQARGDVFVYRLIQLEVDVLNLNPGLLTGIYAPIYMDVQGHQRDRTLFVFFDAAGRVTGAAGRGA